MAEDRAVHVDGKRYVWRPEWDARALREGWLLSADDRIERDDDAPKRKKFKDDDAALAHVKRRAAEGSKMHQTALYFHNLPDE